MGFIDFSTYRTRDIESRLRRIGVRPLDVMVTGVTGAGKSTTLNKFFQKTVAKVGKGVSPETMRIGEYRLNDFFRVWDTPGLGDGISADQKHMKKIIDLLSGTYTIKNEKFGLIDMCIVIIEGANRDMGTTYKLLNEVIVPSIQRDRIFVIINQADMAMKGRHWNYITSEPDSCLMEFLNEQSLSVVRRRCHFIPV